MHMNLGQRQIQIRWITTCQVCGTKLKRPVRGMVHPSALVTCSKEACHKYATKCWLSRPSGILDDE